ncbi:MAG: hypothetical protein R3F37_13640 [Candidatus Competibacteraceae bacterium]
MNAVVALVCWLLTVLIGWWLLKRDLHHRFGPPLVMISCLAVLGLLLLGLALPVDETAESLPLAPEAAFMSVWALLLLAVLRRLTSSVQIPLLSFRQALVALTAVGLAFAVGRYLVVGQMPALWLMPVLWGVLTTLFLVGFLLCRLDLTDIFPWEYAAWFAGFTVMTNAGMVLGLDLGLASAHGGAMMLFGFSFSALLYWLERPNKWQFNAHPTNT